MINVSGSNPQPQPTAAPPNMSPPPQAATTQQAPDLATQQPSPVTPNQDNKSRYLIIGGIILAILAIGGLASLFLVQQPQDTRQQAAQCVEQCPGNDGILRSCTPPEADGSSNDSICSARGRVESCGGVDYCCPAPGGTWTTNMTACATPTPEPSPTEVPGLCSSDSVASCRTLDPGDSCNTDGGECTTDGTTGEDEKDICTCVEPVTPTPTQEPTATPQPTSEPTTAPTAGPTSEPTTAPTTAPTSSATTAPTQPPLPSELPETGPADWLRNLSVGLGAIGAGALLFLFL